MTKADRPGNRADCKPLADAYDLYEHTDNLNIYIASAPYVLLLTHDSVLTDMSAYCHPAADLLRRFTQRIMDVLQMESKVDQVINELQCLAGR